MRFHQRHVHHTKAIKALGLNGTFIGLAYAALETVWPIYIFSFFPGESQVGFVSAIFSVTILASLFLAYPLFKKFKPQQLLFASVSANALILALYANIQSPVTFIILGMLSSVLAGIRVQAFGVLLRHNSSQKRITNDESYIYFLANVGWIIGPLIGGYVANSIAIRAVMIVSSIALLLSVYSITYSQHEFRNGKTNGIEEKINFTQNIKNFFRNKKRILSYCLSGGLEVWWTIPYIFLPIIMIEKYGLNIGNVGIFLFALVVPLMLVEYGMQRREVKSKNIKNIIGIGYMIATLVSLVAGLTNSIFIMLGAFVIGSFGIGLIEPSVESYFFSITKENESEKFYGSFMTAKQVGSFVGKILVATLLLVLPIQISILAIGLITFGLGAWSLYAK